MSDPQNLNDLMVGLLNRVTTLEEKIEVQAQENSTLITEMEAQALVISTLRTEMEAQAQKIIELEEDSDAQSLKNAKTQVDVQDSLKAMELSGMKFMNDTHEGFRELWKELNRCSKIEQQRFNELQTAISAQEELIQTFAKNTYENGMEIKKLQKCTTHQVPHSSELVTKLDKKFQCNICFVTWFPNTPHHEPNGEKCQQNVRKAARKCQPCPQEPQGFKTKVYTE